MNKKDLTTKTKRKEKVIFNPRNNTCFHYLVYFVYNNGIPITDISHIDHPYRISCMFVNQSIHKYTIYTKNCNLDSEKMHHVDTEGTEGKWGIGVFMWHRKEKIISSTAKGQ